ncbi:unnamed protein product [Urochloa humidicola]
MASRPCSPTFSVAAAPQPGDRGGLRVRRLGVAVPPAHWILFGEASQTPARGSARRRSARSGRAWNISTSSDLQFYYAFQKK